MKAKTVWTILKIGLMISFFPLVILYYVFKVIAPIMFAAMVGGLIFGSREN
jgi:hypothetical protein